MSEAKTTLKIESAGTILELELLDGYGYLKLREKEKEDSEVSFYLEEYHAKLVGDFLLNKWIGILRPR